jgi:hypothetical protein
MFAGSDGMCAKEYVWSLENDTGPWLRAGWKWGFQGRSARNQIQPITWMNLIADSSPKPQDKRIAWLTSWFCLWSPKKKYRWATSNFWPRELRDKKFMFEVITSLVICYMAIEKWYSYKHSYPQWENWIDFKSSWEKSIRFLDLGISFVVFISVLWDLSSELSFLLRER